MRKKIALFSAGLALTVGGFGTYWYATGTNPFVWRPTDHSQVENQVEINIRPEVTTFRWEDRAKDSTLRYVIEADRLEGDPTFAGVYHMTRPRATYFNRDGQRLVLTADSGRIQVDRINDPQKAIVKGGRLSGNVKLTMGPEESFVDAKSPAVAEQIVATLAKDIEFDYIRRELSSLGAIQVRSNRVAFDGHNLTVGFNTEPQRIEHLRIDRGEKIILKNVGAGGLGGGSRGGQQTASACSGGGAAAPVANNTTAAAGGAAASNPAEMRTVYRLAFGQDVKAAWGERTLTAQQMAVIFQTSNGEVADRAVARTEAPAPPAVPTNPAPVATGSQPATTAPLPEATGEDLVITWVGPMEMRPADPNSFVLASNKDMMFEAVGTREKPVVVNDGPRVARAGRVVYQSSAQEVRMAGLAAGMPIELADAGLGKVTCAALAYNQASGALRLSGPGRMEVTDAALAANEAAGRSPLVVRWKDTFDVQLASAEDPKRPGKTMQVVKHASLKGNVDLRDDTFHLAGETLDAKIAQTGDAKSPQALEHLLATGGVEVESFRGAGGTVQPEQLSGDRFEVRTAKAEGSRVPRPAVVLMDGNAQAVTYQADKNDPNALLKQQISTPKLAATLLAKATDKKDDVSGFAVKEFTGTDGVRVELEGFGKEAIVATAETLTADAQAGTAKLAAKKGGLAQVQQGENAIAGGTILLDQKAQAMEIPGAGTFTFYQAAQKQGEKPLKMAVSWDNAMKYSGKEQEALFTGPVVAKLVDRPEQSSEMSAEKLRVKFAAARGGGGNAGAANAGGQRPAEISAEGKVKVTGATYSPKGELETRMLLQNVDKLVYDDARKVMTIPGGGALFVEDRRPDVAESAGGARGLTAFRWKDGFTYDSESGLIRLKKDVLMVHEPTKPIRLDLAAGAGGKNNDAALPAGTRVTLLCQDLAAYLATDKSGAGTAAATTSSPMALGTNGQVRVSKVVADTATELTIAKDKLVADRLAFDVDNNTATAEGRDGNVAILEREESGTARARKIQFNLKTGEFTTEGPEIRAVVPEGK